MKKTIVKVLLLLLASFLLIFFIFKNSDQQHEKIISKGKVLYTEHCARCHGEQGEGFKKLYPPLTDSTVLSINNIYCTIKYGKQTGTVIHGQEYTQPMPAMQYIENDEIAAIINFIYNDINDWNRKEVKLKDINAAMHNCY